MCDLHRLSAYEVRWDSPSRDSSGSMPIGNGDFGANVWVEENSDLLLLLSKTDAWDENSINLKLGRVRVALSPNPFAAEGAQFTQVLSLRAGEIQIIAGARDALTALRIWVDTNHPVLRIE